MSEELSDVQITDQEVEDGEENLSDMDDEDYMDESDVNFEDLPAYAHLPPLDSWRKVRRELLKALNQTREEEVGGLPEVHMDWLASEGLQEYAKYVLEDEEDSDKIPEFIGASKSVGKYIFCTAVTILEDEVTESKHLIAPFLDAHGLISELYRTETLDSKLSHVGIGVGILGKRLALVYGYAKKQLVIESLNVEDNGILVVQGRMLIAEQGVYASQISTVIGLKGKKTDMLETRIRIRLELENKQAKNFSTSYFSHESRR